MSASTCSTVSSPVPTRPRASPANMKASSESGLWAMRTRRGEVMGGSPVAGGALPGPARRPGSGSEDGVDERRQRRALGEHDEQADQQQHDDDRPEPPLLLVLHEV